MLVHKLSAAEKTELAELAAVDAWSQWSIADPAFYRAAALEAHSLPRSLRAAVLDFKLRERAGAMLVRGIPVTAVGPTPSHWKLPPADAAPSPEEVALVLVASLLGDVFAWSTQQDGRVIHNVLPIREHADEQLGSGSRELLWWHTEDAFHEHRADYVLLMCLRNPDDVPTTYADVSALTIPDDDAALLSAPAYRIRPDNSHLPQFAGTAGAAAEAADTQEAAVVSVLFGGAANPYVRLDPYFMDSPREPDQQRALQQLRQHIDQHLQEVVLRPGDCILLDNYRSVHGRAPFAARFDGQDRWLKRVNVTRDIRRSRALRRGTDDRVLHG